MEEKTKHIVGLPTGKAHSDEVKQELEQLKEDQRLLIQWAEEKVQLASNGHELLEKYAHALDGDIANLTQYLTDSGQLVDEYMADEYGGMGDGGDPLYSDSMPARRMGSYRFGPASSGELEVQEIKPGELMRPKPWDLFFLVYKVELDYVVFVCVMHCGMLCCSSSYEANDNPLDLVKTAVELYSRWLHGA